MDLMIEQPGNKYVVNAYSPGALRVAGKLHVSPIILSATKVIENWVFNPMLPADMTLANFEPLLALKPELIVIGTGEKTRQLPAKLVFELYQRGIGFECMDTAAACRTYNITIGDGRRVVAGLAP